MSEYRHSISFFSAVAIYISIAVFFFYFQNTIIGTEKKPKEQIITLSMSEFMPEQPQPIEEVEPEKVEEPEVVEPEPLKEEIKPEEPVVEEVKPEPIVEKIIPKPIVKKIVKKKILKRKKPKKKIKKKVKKRVHKKAVSKKSRKKVKQSKRASKTKASPAKKNRFLNQLRTKINRYKSYPRIAQRRGMQGSVKVRFTILANGHVGSISVSGPKVFHTSVKRAVKKAFPISVKNAPLSLPTTVNLTLRYQMK